MTRGSRYEGPQAWRLLMDVLRLVADGNTNARIARQLNISEDTVKGRISALFRHLGARDRAHAVSLGYQLGHLKAGRGRGAS